VRKDKRTPDDHLRPIGARALKSVTDTLRPWLAGARALDLFAGQGRLGLAALEEEAEDVTFVELDARSARAIAAAARQFQSRARVLNEDAFTFLSRARNEQKKYDLIFADPPFPLWNADFSERLFALVAAVTAEEAIFLVKYPSRMLASNSSNGFSLWKTSLFGESRLMYWNYGSRQ
jgi:16S rRNA (guanine966-N2)-methyltransferase